MLILQVIQGFFNHANRKASLNDQTSKAETRPFSANAGVRIVLASSALLLSSTISTQAKAQSSLRVEQLARDNGYSRSELADYDLAQISPFYDFNERWTKCYLQATILMLRNEQTPAVIERFATSSCEDDERRLRALMGARIGLPRATRVTSLGKLIMKAAISRAWNDRHPNAARTQNIVAEVGAWIIQKVTPGKCLALRRDGNGYSALRFSSSGGALQLLVRTDFKQPAVGSVSTNRIVIGHHPAPTYIESTIYVTALADGLGLQTSLSTQDVSFLQYSASLAIKHPDSEGLYSEYGDEEIPVYPDTWDAIQALKRC